MDKKLNFPLASNIALRDFYVDVLLTGASSPEEAKKLISELQDLMKRDGFELRKWASNNISVLKKNLENVIQTESDLMFENDN